MNFAGATLQSNSLRNLSSPSAPAESTINQPMRRGLTRLGAALADSASQLPLLQRLTGPCRLCLGTLASSPARAGLSAAELLPRAYGSRTRAEGDPAAAPPYEPIGDRALVNAKRNAEEAKRLAKNYEAVSAAQLRRARQAALGLPGGAGARPRPGSALMLADTLSEAPGEPVRGHLGDGQLRRSLPPLPPPPPDPPAEQVPPPPQQQQYGYSGRQFSTLACWQLHPDGRGWGPPGSNGSSGSGLAPAPLLHHDPHNHRHQHQATGGNGGDHQHIQQRAYLHSQPQEAAAAVAATTSQSSSPSRMYGATPLQYAPPPPPAQQLQKQRGEARDLSDVLQAVLWEGHIRDPEQTCWAEASTSGSSGSDAAAAAAAAAAAGTGASPAAAAAAARWMLGSRRQRAGSRVDALAVARRTYVRPTTYHVYGSGNGNGATSISVDGPQGSVEAAATNVSGVTAVKQEEAAGAATPLAVAGALPALVLQRDHHVTSAAASAAEAKGGFTRAQPHQLQLQPQEQDCLPPPPPPPQQQQQQQQQQLDFEPVLPKRRAKRVRRDAAGAPSSDPSAGQASADIDADTTPLTAARRTRRKKPPADAAAAADGTAAADDETTTAAASRAGVKLAPPPSSDDEVVKPYLQPGLRPMWPPVPLAGYDGYFEACEGYCTRQPLAHSEPPDVLIVNTPEVARAVVDKLMAVKAAPYPNNRINPPVSCRYFACDTEVAFIDVSSETPVGHGAVLCISIYGGDDLDFSDCERVASTAATRGSATGWGEAPAAAAVRKDRIWVDVWGEVQLDDVGRPVMDGRYVRLKPHHPILDQMKRFFEDDSAKKVWHNYGFDRHVLENMGICCAGFAGDTLHMARLADASRSGKRTYGLDSLTGDKDIMRHFVPMKAQKPPRELTGAARRAARMGAGAPAAATAAATASVSMPGGGGGGGSSPGDKRAAEVAKLVRAKVSMKDRFGLIKVRGGVPGKVPELPAMQHLHSMELFRATWIDYSALDAKATWQLREALEGLLRLERWEMEPALARKLGYDSTQPAVAGEFLHLWHFYCSYWLDFGELLTEMERRGMMVNRVHLAEAQRRAEADKQAAMQEFLDWANSKVPGARYMNAHSGLQIRMLLFPDYPGFATKAAAVEASKAKAAANRAAKKAAASGAANQQQQQQSVALTAEAAAAAAQAVGGGRNGEDGTGSDSDGGSGGSMLPNGVRVIKVPNPHYERDLELGKKSSRYMNLELHGIWGRGVPGRLQPELLTATNAAAVSIKVLRGLAGKPGAARKELARLLEARAAAAADSRAAVEAAAAAAAAAEAAARVPVVGDVLDEALQELSATAEAEGGPGEGEGEEALMEAPEAGEGAESAAACPGPVPVVDDPAQMEVLEREAKEKGLGRLYAACGGGEEGLRACVAVEALCEISAIDKLLSAFIIPLQSDDTSTTRLLPAAPGSDSPTRAVHRVHCSLNINTETGRLSARRPNLQNQPALEKDRYKVRQAFTADTESGQTLVVADYGQLELRLLAHMTDCASMKEAFVLGGDFHSRTAYGMYDYIQEAVKKGECYLEWEGQGEPDKPLVKDKYASERRKAKVLNFSIAYGKTAHGLAVDFKTSKEEAQETVDKWYSDRWEVRKWQEDTRKGAREELKVRTLLGRTRPLPNINSPDFKLSGHSSRAAINTPIQGSAADVAAAAMVAIHKSEALRATGFKLLMQIHDEVILEGPRDRSGDAKSLVMALMANPWAELSRHWNAPAARGLMEGPGWYRPPPQLPGGHLAGVWRHGGEVEAAGAEKQGEGEGAGKGVRAMPLLVELATDCNVADTWYEAK